MFSGLALTLSALMIPANSAAAVSATHRPASAAATAPPNVLGGKLRAELGPQWWRSTDLAITSSSDAKGIHYFIARESEGYFWRPLASILPGGADTGSWTGYFCVSGDNRYILATVAPMMADSRPDLEDRGALAYVIDIATGQVHPLIAGVAMYYDAAGCGTGDTGVLARFPGSNETRTTLITANLRSATVVRRQTLPGQFTSAIPAGAGVIAYRGGAIVSVGHTGSVRKVVPVPGAAYDISASAGGGLDFLTTRFGALAQAWHLPEGRNARSAEIASGPRMRLKLFAGAGGRNVVVGATNTMRGAKDATRVIPVPANPLLVSRQGKVVETDQVTGKGAARFTAVPDLVSTATGVLLQRTLPAAAPAFVAVPSRAGGTFHPAHQATGLTPAVNTTTPACAVPRLNPQRQVMQPNGHQVEWAVDEAVRGDLTVSRPANYDNMGLPAYSPQGDIPAPALTGGGTIPPQVLLGILAQESNLDQASWHALPGYAGDPLIADYYGSGGGIDTIDYSQADCGYGIGQITTGMTAGSTFWGGGAATQAKLAVDYAENIAAAVSLLSQKWNQLASYSPAVLANGGNAADVDNWYLAIWAYNTGLDPNSSTGNTAGCTPGPSCTDNGGAGGNWGLGWTNNPLDTDWNPSREPFLSSTYADAAHPGDWPYQEKVLGWAAESLLDYTGTRSYTSIAGYPSIAPFGTFCTTADNCNPSNSPACALSNFHCWWHTPVSWVNCSVAGACHPGVFAYAVGAAEPSRTDPYPPDCNSTLPSTASIVDDEPVDYNIVGCGTVNWHSTGTFTLTQGTNPAGVPTSLIDTHQIGAGFGGHLFFTHNYAASDTEHLVTGTWKVSLPAQAYHVLVHIPNTGGTTTSAHYNVVTANGTVFTDVVDQYQQQNQWVGLGYYSMGANAAVTLNNVTDDGALGVHDVGYDAVAFVPVSGTAVNHSFDAVSLFNWNTNLNTNVPSAFDTPSRTMQTLHDWAIDYGYQGPLWSKPSDHVNGVSSYPQCASLSVITSGCVPADVWSVGNTWATDAQEAGTAPPTSSTPVMSEPTWLGYSNPTPGPSNITSSTFSIDANYKIKTHIDISYIVSGGKILPGSDQVNTIVRTGSTPVPAFVLGFMKAVQTDYGVAPPNLSYDEVDANTFSGDATPVNPYSTGLAPGRQYVWHSDPSLVTDNGACVDAQTVTGGMIGWRSLAAQTSVAASVSAWVAALQGNAKVNSSVAAMAGEINDFFFAESVKGGSLFLHAPPIWQDTHIQVCADGTISAGTQNGDSDDTPEFNLVYQSYMPDLYLYFDNKIVNQSGGAGAGPVQAGDFADFANIPGVTSGTGNPYGTCVSDENGNAGNPWGLSTTDAPDTVPKTGQFCDSTESFGNPFPGG